MTGTINLASLGSGIAGEKFDEEFQRVLANVLDPNTEARAKRSVTITVTVRPDRDRQIVQLDVAASSKLAPSVSYSTRAYVGKDRATQQVLAFEDNPHQTTIDDFIKSTEDIAELPTKAEAAT